MAAPPISERHLPHFHRRSPVKELVRVATTANITIATALNSGDTIDGVTLANGDRVLVKDQSTASQNGIYEVSASPARAYDLASDDPGFGYLVVVIQGTANGGTIWRNTNTSAPTIGSTSVTFAQISGVQAGAITTSGLTMATARLLGRTTASTGAVEEISIGSGLTLAAGSLSASGGSGTVTTVEEVDGSPTDSAVTKIVFPNGTLSIASHVATYTPTGGSGTRAFGLDRASFDGTYGDDFDGASLNGRWTRHNQTSGQETYQVGGLASALQVAHGTTNAAEYIYQTDPNNTNQTWEASFSWRQTTSTGQMFGIICVTSAGTGVAAMLYDNTQGYYVANVASHTFSSSLASQTFPTTVIGYLQSGGRLWLRLRKASGLYAASYSLDGQVYSPEVSGTPTSFTPDRIGVGRFLGTNAGSVVNWHWFDKTA